MDAFELLRNDHAAVMELFGRYGELEDDELSAKAALFRRLREELEAHAAIEEEVFYPAVRNANPAIASALIRESYETQRLIRQILRDLSLGIPGVDDFDGRFMALRENVLRHVEEEEQEVFAEARASMTPLQLRLLGGTLSDRKRELGGRVHRARPALATTARRALTRVGRAVTVALRRARGGAQERSRRSSDRSSRR